MSAALLNPAALERLAAIGGPTLVSRMVALFLQHAPARLEAAQQGARANDLQAVASAAHSLKSTAGNVGGERLQAAAERLEHAATAREEARVPELLREMEAAFQATVARLADEHRATQP